MNSIYAVFQHAEFSTMQTFVLGSMHTALSYKAQWLKIQKLVYWKPTLNIRKQNSSHLQDICNVVSTKYHAK